MDNNSQAVSCYNDVSELSTLLSGLNLGTDAIQKMNTTRVEGASLESSISVLNLHSSTEKGVMRALSIFYRQKGKVSSLSNLMSTKPVINSDITKEISLLDMEIINKIPLEELMVQLLHNPLLGTERLHFNVARNILNVDKEVSPKKILIPPSLLHHLIHIYEDHCRRHVCGILKRNYACLIYIQHNVAPCVAAKITNPRIVCIRNIRVTCANKKVT